MSYELVKIGLNTAVNSQILNDIPEIIYKIRKLFESNFESIEKNVGKGTNIADEISKTEENEIQEELNELYKHVKTKIENDIKNFLNDIYKQAFNISKNALDYLWDQEVDNYIENATEPSENQDPKNEIMKKHWDQNNKEHNKYYKKTNDEKNAKIKNYDKNSNINNNKKNQIRKITMIQIKSKMAKNQIKKITRTEVK